jgi:hypothetical protein
MKNDHITLADFQQGYVDAAASAYPGRRFTICGTPAGSGKTAMMGRLVEELASRIESHTGKQPTAWVSTVLGVKEQHFEEMARLDRRITTDMDVFVIDGQSASARLLQIELAKLVRPKWVLFHHEVLRMHPEEMVDALDPECDVFMLDEADVMGNVASEVSLAAQALACRAHYRGVYTATLIRNWIDSLYPLLKIANPAAVKKEWLRIGGKSVLLPHPHESREFGGMMDFLRQYAYVDKFGRVKGARNKPELHRRLVGMGAMMLDFEEFLGIIGVTVNEPLVVTQPLAPAKQVIYDLVKAGIVKWVERHERDFRGSYGEERAMYLRRLLTQINYARRAAALAPTVFTERIRQRVRATESDDEESLELDLKDLGEALASEDEKTRWYREYIRDTYLNGHGQASGGIAIYSEWTDVHDQLEAGLQKEAERLGYGRIDGTVTARARDTARLGVKHGDVRLAILGDSGNRGMNLQNLCDVGIFNPPWTWTQVQQTLGRVTRFGQKNSVQPIFTIAKDTIEAKKIYPMIQRKKRDSDEILGGGRGKVSRSVLGDIASMEEVLEWL